MGGVLEDRGKGVSALQKTLTDFEGNFPIKIDFTS